MISKDFKIYLEQQLSNKYGFNVEIIDFSTVFGGDINESFTIKTSNGSYFIKINDAIAFPNMFEAEAKGLDFLISQSSFVIPEPIIIGTFENKAFLLLEYLSLQNQGNWFSFGEILANMHKRTAPNFGLEYPNYIGSLIQKNNEMNSWAEFYMEQRLLPLSIKARELGLLDKEDLRNLDLLHMQLGNIYPIEPPSLLHGDLWSGNASFCQGKSCVYDPAIYYGHREIDIAMTLLFGGFPKEMYTAYNTVYPLENGWQNRIELSQLYPLLVHTCLFGESYANQVRAILKKYS